MSAAPLQTHKVSTTFSKPNFTIPQTFTTASSNNYTEIKLTTRATSPILLDSNKRIISSCNYSSLCSISATSFSISLKSVDSQRKSLWSTSHSSTQTEDFVRPSNLTNIGANSSTRQIKCISFVQPKSLIKFDEQPSVTSQTTAITPLTPLTIKHVELKNPSPPPPPLPLSLASQPTSPFVLNSIQKQDHDSVVKTKPYQLVSFNLDTSAKAVCTAASKFYATTSTNTEVENRSTTITKVDKCTNTESDEYAASERAIYASTRNIQVQTQSTAESAIHELDNAKREKMENIDEKHEKKGNLQVAFKRRNRACKVDLEYILKCYLMNDFRKNDLNELREKLLNLMVLVNSTCYSLQNDNRRLHSYDNGLIKCINRNMLNYNLEDNKVNLLFILIFYTFIS